MTFLKVIDGKSGTLRGLRRSLLIVSSVYLMVPTVARASVEVCQPPDGYSRLSLGYFEQERSYLERDAGRVVQKRQDVELEYRLNDEWSIGAGHRYAILDIEPIELQTNGHLHTVYFPLHSQRNFRDRSFRFSVAPALSASSNVMKDPGEYGANTFQLLAAIVWSRELSDRTQLRYGLCGDHSFGKYAVYPSITFDWRPGPDLSIQLGVPVTRLAYEASRAVELSLQVSPDGNEWQVKSKDLAKQSRLVVRALLIEWALRWQASEHVGVTVGVARAFENRYEVTLLDDRRVALSQDAATRVGAALDWRF